MPKKTSGFEGMPGPEHFQQWMHLWGEMTPQRLTQLAQESFAQYAAPWMNPVGTPQAKSASGSAGAPRDADPFASNPFASNPFASNAFAANPFSSNPFTSPPFGATGLTTGLDLFKQASEHPLAKAAMPWASGLNLGPLSLDPEKLSALQTEYMKDWTDLMEMAAPTSPHHRELSKSTASDKRFSGGPWQMHDGFALTAALYLLNARYLQKMSELVEGDAKVKSRLKFAVQQFVDAMAPSNFFATNPEAQARLIETHGESLRKGLENLIADISKGRISQTDESAFEVGRNVATTEGSVVFENELFQLIHFKPIVAEVGSRPLLLVPPCINKYYIMDLQPDNSLVRFALSQGHNTFLVSWRNVEADQGKLTWDDYIEKGAIQAIETIRQLTQQPTINLLGFCVGGTIVSTAVAVLAARGVHAVESLTLMTTLLDFSDTGVLDVFVDEAHVKMREQAIGNGGLMPGRELAAAFSSLRPNDLIWNYVVNNYLKGESPPAFDLLFWNSDSTNLPGPMYCWYLRNTYLEDNLKVPGKCTVAGVPLNLKLVNVPTYVMAAKEDHIVPWKAGYRSALTLGATPRFVLGASGHIAGAINPASKNKRSYWALPIESQRSEAGTRTRKTSSKVKAASATVTATASPSSLASLPADPDQWLDQATEVPGSWWNDWAAWLAPLRGNMIKAPSKLGSPQFPVIEPAPGRYVKARA